MNLRVRVLVMAALLHHIEGVCKPLSYLNEAARNIIGNMLNRQRDEQAAIERAALKRDEAVVRAAVARARKEALRSIRAAHAEVNAAKRKEAELARRAGRIPAPQPEQRHQRPVVQPEAIENKPPMVDWTEQVIEWRQR